MCIIYLNSEILVCRKFSFRDYKKVGVAIYANGIEDIKSIWEKISTFPDFIHVDIIDETFSNNTPNPKAYRLETIEAFWPQKDIHCHQIFPLTKSTVLLHFLM